MYRARQMDKERSAELLFEDRQVAPVTGQSIVLSSVCNSMANVDAGRCFSLVIWDENTEIGYQLLGKMEQAEDLGVCGGCLVESKPRNRQMLFCVERLVEFGPSRHNEI